MDDHQFNTTSCENKTEVSPSHPYDYYETTKEMANSDVGSDFVSVNQGDQISDMKRLTSNARDNEKHEGRLRGLENPAYETDPPVAENGSNGTQEHFPLPFPNKDGAAFSDSGLHSKTCTGMQTPSPVTTNDNVDRPDEPHFSPSSSSQDITVDLGNLVNPIYEEETPTTLTGSVVYQVQEDCENVAPPSPTASSSISEDVAIDLNGIHDPADQAERKGLPHIHTDNNPDKTASLAASSSEESIHIEMEEESLKNEARDGETTPTTSKGMTAEVENVDENGTDGQPLPSPPPPSDSCLVGTIAFNTMLLASGDSLPSLPPPHVLPVDETTAQILISDSMDKAALAELEMKILQKTESVSPPGAERCDSQLSTLSDKIDICRICHCEGEENNKLISPCLCSGSLKYLHLACLQKWIKSSDKKACELCNFDYVMSSKTRPFREWERLEMSHTERRKVVCSVTFHIIAITCVIWSLYVLIDRTTEEVHLGTLDWPFWTKLIVVAIGFTGGMIFMYVQCKMYAHLCVRWRAFNKLIFVENAPEDPQLRAEAAARIKDKAHEEGGMVNPVALQELDAV